MGEASMNSRYEGLPFGVSAALAADPTFAGRAIAVAARESGASPAQLLSRWRAPRELVIGRFAVMLALSSRGAGVTAIGRNVKRDHSTVAHGIRRARALLDNDPHFAALYRRVDAA